MDKRLAKRHKRAVERAKAHVKLSEPDLRTPEEIKEAREKSRPAGGRIGEPNMISSSGPVRSGKAPGTGSAAKTDV
jgi:hypothetical protein